MSLLDVLIAMTILTVAILSLLGLVAASLQLETVNRETTQAVQAARRVIEEISARPFDEVFATYNADPSDDPGGAGSAPAASFAVEGLLPLADDADGLVGEIVFPEVAGALREDVVDAALGTPMDLDLDDVIDGADHASDYRVLPIQVRLRWRGRAGASRYEITTMLRGE